LLAKQDTRVEGVERDAAADKGFHQLALDGSQIMAKIGSYLAR
jgi:hypothetical protein